MNKNVKLDKEKESVTVQIRALSHDGRGIGIITNKTTFISGALPNEKVAYKITQKHSHFNEAETLKVINASSERVIPPCHHFGICGGCSLQHMRMEAQLQLKQQTLLDQLQHFGRVIPEALLPALTGETLGYRRKARLGVKFVFKKNKLLVGFREKSSRYLADIERCVILHPHIGEHLKELGQLISSLECFKQIPQVEVAMGETKAALIFRHLEPLSFSDEKKLIDFGKTFQFDLYLQPNPPGLINKLWPNEKHQLGYTLPDYQLELLFHPLDFTQINLEMNRLMINQAIRLLDLESDDHVLDLFCGIGNFSLPIARFAKQVTGIEVSIDMVNRAEDNAKHNNIKNVKFFAANLQETSSLQAPWKEAHYNKVLLDPPRTGAKEILTYFKKFLAQKIVYVSCNPATLARDAGELVHQYGYQLKQVGIMNMFPHTSHIEAMAVFEKT